MIFRHPSDIIPAIDHLGYVIEEDLATVLYLLFHLE